MLAPLWCFSKYLQRAFNCDGEENFVFIILEKCPVDLLDQKEREYIERMCLTDNALGYNLENGGNVGKEVSEAARESKRGINNPMYGRKLSKEHIQQLRIKNRGHRSSLTEDQVEEIKILLAHDNISTRKIGEIFGVSRDVICKIKTGKNWYWVRSDLNECISDEYKKRIRDQKILEMSENGFSRNQISRELKIAINTVEKILDKPSNYFYGNSKRKQDLKKNVIEDFEHELSKQEIMEKYSINSSMYVKLTHDAYVKKQEDLKTKAIKMRKSGMMVKDIAKELGFARTTISRWTKSVK